MLPHNTISALAADDIVSLKRDYLPDPTAATDKDLDRVLNCLSNSKSAARNEWGVGSLYQGD